MNNLIYLPLAWLRRYDPYLQSQEYRHNHWFNMHSVTLWPEHLTSRVHKLNTPWDLAPSVCPMPKLLHNSELRFDVVMDSITHRFCDYIQRTGKTPYISWSGGIDSTSILVSLLKVGNSDFLKKLVVLYNDRSIKENSFFYHRFLDGKVSTLNFDQSPLHVTADNYDQIVILDGEVGNQVMGSPHINSLVRQGRRDILDSDWTTIQDYSEIIYGSTDYHIQMIKDSAESAPVEILTVFDFLWWLNFNFKVDDVLLRKMLTHVHDLTPDQSREFWESGIFRHYAQPEMQQWSLVSKNQRHQSIEIMLKYIPKKYIYDFDHNDIWYAHKTEQASMASTYEKCTFGDSGIIALDSDWNKYSLKDQETRRKLGRILQRIS